MIYLNLCKTVHRKITPNRSGIFRQLMRYPKQQTVLKPNYVHPRPLFDLRKLKSVASTRLPSTRHFATSNAQTGTKDVGMVQFQFLWRLMGLGDMTPPPLNPKEISVVPLKDLLTYTKEGGAAPTSMDEMDTYNRTINDLLAHCDLTHYLPNLPNHSLTNSQYSRLDNILVGKTISNHYWLLKFVDFDECLREFVGPCLATICEERSMVLKHLMMHVKDDGQLEVLDPFKPQIAMKAKENNKVFVARQFFPDSMTLNDNGDISNEVKALTAAIPSSSFIRNYVLLHWVLSDADFNNPGNFLIENRLNAPQGKALTSIDYGQILQYAPGNSGYRRGTLPDRRMISKTFEGGPNEFFKRQCADGFNPMLRLLYVRFFETYEKLGVPRTKAKERALENLKHLKLRSGDQKRFAYKAAAIELFLKYIGLPPHPDHLKGLERLQENDPVTLFEIVTGWKVEDTDC
ncbi:MAG: hypothetical protein VXX85_04255 [Candidatus Margulisiibacteriota bacterium]|nr:hypothetical protein [Candidatus Margulisiibacteriota bacterium]